MNLRSLALALSLLTFGTVPAALAQRGAAEVTRKRALDAPQANLYPPASGDGVTGPGGREAGGRPAVLLTGYWPPSNEMLRRFSPNPGQNPMGWVGGNWEGRGYDVYSYFPEFTPPDCFSCGQGSGDLEVDYQDTSMDFWPIANALQPIAVITFSRGSINTEWEVEMNQYNRDQWAGDYAEPFQPTPSPPDASLPAGALRLSTLPVQAIVDDVSASGLGVDPFICFTGDGGGFLSEFMAYHGVWYQALHVDPMDPAWCVAGGHVHVGSQVDWDTARLAAEVTLRTVLDYVDSVQGCGVPMSYCVTSPNSVGMGALIGTTGSHSITQNGFRLRAAYAPPKQFGVFFYGGGQTQVPFGDGQLCVSGEIFRLNPPGLTDFNGVAERPLDFTHPPLGSGTGMVTPGSSWNFQYWYRDPAAGGSGFNTSDAVAVKFCP